MMSYKTQKRKEAAQAFWKSIPITQSEKNQIRLVLLRYKWGVETRVDAFLLADFYIKWKTEKMPDFELYSPEKYILKIRKIVANVFL